jgi:predicted porin
MQKAFAQQKKLIVIVLAAAAFSSPVLAETANVSVYGTADMSIDLIDTGSTAAGVAGVSKTAISSNVSKLGFKGAVGLDNGLSGIWQIEQQINMDNSGGTFATRNTFLGLKSDSAGTVLLGRHDTPYKLTTRKLDIFGDSIADNRALLGGISSAATTTAANAVAHGKSAGASFDGRQPDVIAYISPAMSGFTGALAYVAGAEATTTAAQIKGSAWSLAGMYDSAPFYGSLGYEVHNIGTVGTGTVAAPTLLGALAGLKESATKFGFGYKFDALDMGFVYEKTSDNFGAAGANLLGHNAYYLSGKYSFGSNAVKLAYGKAGQLGAIANSGASQLSVGYDHGLNKSTKLYAIYSRISNQSAVNYAFSQTTATSANGAGASPSVFSFGMKYSF